MSGAGHVADMNNRLNRNRALKPSNRRRFKEGNRETIYSDCVPVATKLTFKVVPTQELITIKNKIRNRAKGDRRKSAIVFIGIVMALLLTIIALII